MAGKKQDIDYILEHHDQLMVEFKYLFTKLQIQIFKDEEEKPGILKGEISPNEDVLEKEEKLLMAAEFEELLAEMENAVFSLDSDLLLKITGELKGCNYAGKSMEEVITKAERKIEMSDFFSAVEMITRWKENAEIGDT